MTEADLLIQRLTRLRQVNPNERRRIRTEAGISLRELATAIGVSHTAIQFWERGKYQGRDSAKMDEYFDLLDRINQVLIDTPQD